MTITPEMAEIIAEAIDDRLIDVHTSLPGRIQTYDPATQTADVELLLDRLLEKDDGTLTQEALPVLQNVQVRFFRTSKFFVAATLEPGDSGDVFFSEASVGQWRATGEVSAPEDVGRCTLSGAVFYPGRYADDEALNDDLTQGLVMGHIGGASVLIKDDDSITINDGTSTVTLDGSGEVKVDNGSGNFTLKVSGQFDANGNLTVDP